MRLVPSQERLNLHRPIVFGNRGSEVHFSLQGQNGRGNSNAVKRRNHRRLRSLARSQNHIYRQVDANSTTGGNSTRDGNSTAGADNVQGSFGSDFSVLLSRGGVLIPIRSGVYCTLGGLSIGSLNSFNKSLSAKPAPANFNGQKTLFSDGSGSIDIDTNLQVSVTLSANAAGTIAPPKLTQFGITFGMLCCMC